VVSATNAILVVEVASHLHLSTIHPAADDIFSLRKVSLAAGLHISAVERTTGLEISIHLLDKVVVVIAIVFEFVVPRRVIPIFRCANLSIELVEFVEVKNAVAIDICLLKVVVEDARVVVLSCQ